jgi:hypothetical protein
VVPAVVGVCDTRHQTIPVSDDPPESQAEG